MNTIQNSQISGAKLLRHWPTLDGIRGIAVLLVLLNHCLSLPPNSTFNRIAGQIPATGWIGVDLFFVLSGFLITGILLDSKTSPNYFRNFFIRRALRIFPLYYACLLLFLVLIPFVAQICWPTSQLTQRFALLAHDQIWYWTYLQNWYYVWLDWWPDAGHLSHLWSLAIEEQFYLVWPFVVWLTSRKMLSWICTGGIILAPVFRWTFLAAGTTWVPPYVATISRIDPMLMGGLIAILIRIQKFQFRMSASVWLAATLVGCALLATLHWQFDALHTSNVASIPYRHSLLGVVFSCLLLVGVSSATGTWSYRFLANPLFVQMGKYSYGMYVIHWPVRHTLAKVPLPLVPVDVQPYAFLLLSTVITAVLAVVSMFLLERPFLELKRFVPSGLSPSEDVPKVFVSLAANGGASSATSTALPS